jgi:hypothetical protein
MNPCAADACSKLWSGALAPMCSAASEAKAEDAGSRGRSLVGHVAPSAPPPVLLRVGSPVLLPVGPPALLRVGSSALLHASSACFLGVGALAATRFTE